MNAPRVPSGDTESGLPSDEGGPPPRPPRPPPPRPPPAPRQLGPAPPRSRRPGRAVRVTHPRLLHRVNHHDLGAVRRRVAIPESLVGEPVRGHGAADDEASQVRREELLGARVVRGRDWLGAGRRGCAEGEQGEEEQDVADSWALPYMTRANGGDGGKRISKRSIVGVSF